MEVKDDISAVIVNYNSGRIIEKCLEESPRSKKLSSSTMPAGMDLLLKSETNIPIM